MNIHEYQAKAVLREFGVPAVIGAKGVERIVEIQLNSAERAMFEKSASAVKPLVDACRSIAPNLDR